MKHCILLLCLVPMTGCVEINGQCRHEEERSAELDAADASQLFVDSLAGDLEVHGIDGADKVAVRGRACARRRRDLEDIRIVTGRASSGLEVRADLGGADMWADRRLDLWIEAPSRLALRIEDSSGDIAVEGFESLSLVDASGDVHLRRIRGAVELEDGSGDLDIADIGSLRLRDDGSGDLLAESVHGDVLVEEDGSGDLRFIGVEGDVIVVDDGSGDIEASGVSGSFEVRDDGSGDVSWDDVAGRVRVPD